MIENLGFKPSADKTNSAQRSENKGINSSPNIGVPNFQGKLINFPSSVSRAELNVNTKLTSKKDIEMYNAINHALTTSQTEQKSPQDNVSRLKKLDALLKNGTLLNNDSNNNTSVLENLYQILTTQRANNFDNVKIIGQVIDTLYKPEIITQVFGDIPASAKAEILNHPNIDARIKQNPELLDVTGSGTCVSASFEYHMARKHPAEFARWAQGLTSKDECVTQIIKSS